MTQARHAGQRRPKASRARPLSSVLVATDFSESGERAVDRATRLAARADARLTVVHVAPRELTRARGARLETRRRAALEATRERVAERAPGLRVDVVLVAGSPYVEIVRQAHALRADLVVMGRRGGHPVRDILLGSTAEQVIRNGDVPVLLVRTRADRDYRHPLVALELDESAPNIVLRALDVLPSPPPALSIVHVNDPPFGELAYSGMTQTQIDRTSRQMMREARTQLDAILRAKLPAELAWTIALRQGGAHEQVVREVEMTRPDLLVLGTHGHSGIAYALLGSVAGEVVREVACDTFITRPGRIRVKRP